MSDTTVALRGSPLTDAVACPEPVALRPRVELELDGDSLTMDDLVAIMETDEVTARLAPAARCRMERTRAGALATLANGQRVYGWNQALGPLKDRALSMDEQREFQRRILLSHAAGVGLRTPDAVARLTLVLRANTMARGTMGVRPDLVDRLLSLVNAGVAPVMPGIGSLGIGDLQPMAAVGLVITGGPAPARFRGRQAPAAEILAEAGLEPSFTLEAGEALALISGSSVVTAGYAAGVARVRRLIDAFYGAFALFLEATRAEPGAFDARIHHERGIPTQMDAAERIRAIVRDSGWMTGTARARLGEDHPRIQDAVSVRATPHILGTILQTLEQAEVDLAREANASTSNPLLFPTDGAYEFVMGGNWDAALLGHAVDTLNAQVTDLAIISHELCGRLLAPTWSYGLPANLTGGPPGLNSGLVQVQTVATAIIPQMQMDAAPTTTLSRPVKFGQEDHNTMAALAVQRLHYNLDRLEMVLAVQLLMTAQAVDLARPALEGLPLGAGTARVHEAIREHIPPLADDRYMTPDLENAIRLIQDNTISRAVRATIDEM